MKKIKVLHITRPTEFGIYRFLLDLIMHIHKDNFDLTVACPTTGHLAIELERRGFRVIPLKIVRSLSFFADVRSFFAILELIKKEKPDIIHTHCSKAGFLGRIAARIMGVHSIYTPNSWYFDEPMHKIKKWIYVNLERFAALFGGMIATSTEAERLDVIKKRIAQPERITTIHNGIDLGFFDSEKGVGTLRKDYGIHENSKVVSMVARLVPQKSPLVFIKAAAIVLKTVPLTTFMVVGDGPLLGDVEVLCKKLKIADKIILAGACHETREIREFLNLMDISVLPSHYEGLPFVALESMYLAKPIVITEIRGIKEVVHHGRDGMVVPIEDVGAIAESILFLLKNEKDAERMGQAARHKVIERFTANRMADRYEKLYIDLLSKKKEDHEGSSG